MSSAHAVSRCLRLGAVLLMLALAACGSDGAGPTPPPAPPPAPPPPPPPDNTRAVSIHAGNQQTAKAGQAVAIPPALRVVNAAGTGVAGVAVTFAVTQGGGSVTGGSQTTGSDGVATVGGWVLGAGANALSATVTGATSGSPVTFTATGEETIVNPAADTTMAGVAEVTSLTVAAGVTVTMTADLVIRATGRVEINGTITGNCRRFEIDGAGEVLVRGTINNTCGDPAVPGAELRIVARQGYALTEATLRSSGDVEVTNDPTLTDASFAAPTPSAVATVGGDAAALVDPPCTFDRARYIADPERAPAGAMAPIGGPGGAGRTFTGRCRGRLVFPGGMLLRGQHGGNGGFATHTDGLEAVAAGGAGGVGGRLRIQALGDITFQGTNRIESGDGGEGGRAVATGSFGAGTLERGAGARATGGAGAAPGLIEIRATGTLAFEGSTEIALGKGGQGGDAYAAAANGMSADAGGRQAQDGGHAEADAGVGGSTPALSATAGGAVTGPANALVSGGNGGMGGVGHADPGNGGAGNPEFPDAGDGGQGRAFGGFGGNAMLRDLAGTLVGDGGDAGKTILNFGNGGVGADRCLLARGLEPGGMGGRGGDLFGTHGRGGTGLVNGDDGVIELTNMGRGGRGGNGWPAGTGGQGGTRTMSKTPVIISFGGPTVGPNGLDCVRIQPLTSTISYTLPQGPCTPPAPVNPSGNIVVLSLFDAAIAGTVTLEPQGANSGGLLIQLNPGSFVEANRGVQSNRSLVPDTRTNFADPPPPTSVFWYFFYPCVARDGGGPFVVDGVFRTTIGGTAIQLSTRITGSVQGGG